MSTPEHPATPPLTRRQMRELRHTGANPIIPPASEEPAPAAEAPAVEAEAPAPGTDAPASGAAIDDAPAEAPAPLPETADADPTPPVAFDPPRAGSGAEFGVAGLTRRQVRAQEQIRTASVPVITSDLEPSARAAASDPVVDAGAQTPSIFRPAPEPEEERDDVDDAATAVVNPALGSELLNGASPEITLPPSFDQLITRDEASTGSVSTPSALILSTAPAGGPLVGPITSTGEVLITGTFELPEGLGSVGHAPGTTDGRDADAVLIDGELPAASSPTPIAASAAISTVKQPGEIIRPPAPEKGSQLVLVLAITAAALALTLVGFLVFAVTTGLF